MPPYLSVIIPALNEAATLADCLKSLQAQKTNFSYEVIVVDNNSSDDTAAIARKLKIKVVKEKKPGVCLARQAGLMAAHGQIIISTDADCTFPADWLNDVGQAFRDQPDLSLLLGNYRFHQAPSWANPLLQLYEWLCLQLHNAFGWTWFVSAANLAFRRSDFPGYDLALTQGGDELYVLQQVKQHGRVLYRFSRPIQTSSRRLAQGFWRTFYKDFLRSYLLNYWQTRRTGINKAGTYAAHRSENMAARRKTSITMFLAASLVAATLFILGGLLGWLLIGRVHHTSSFVLGYFALTLGFLAYASLSPHSQLAGPQSYRVRTKRRVVALTFDDGPNDQFSLEIAACIERYGGRASFFQVGQNIRRQPEITRQLFDQGHLIGNHSTNHRFSDYLRSGWQQNLVETNELITQVTGQAPRFMRFPWLFRTPWLIATAYRLGLQPVAGTFLNVREFKQPDGLKMARQFAAKVRPGDIIIMHDGYNASGADRLQTVRAVAELCRRLQADGYSFVRLDELL